MKKKEKKIQSKRAIKIFIVLLCNFSFIYCGRSFSWSWFSGKIFSKGFIESETYELETQGNNGRVYIFTHPKNQNIECVQVALTDAGGLSCYHKR